MMSEVAECNERTLAAHKQLSKERTEAITSSLNLLANSLHAGLMQSTIVGVLASQALATGTDVAEALRAGEGLIQKYAPAVLDLTADSDEDTGDGGKRPRTGADDQQLRVRRVAAKRGPWRGPRNSQAVRASGSGGEGEGGARGGAAAAGAAQGSQPGAVEAATEAAGWAEASPPGAANAAGWA
jgi:hypothetical protein